MSYLPKKVDRLPQFRMLPCELIERRAGGGRLPSLSVCRNTGGRSAGMGNDPAAGQIHEIERFRLPVRFRCLPAPLTGRDNRHDAISAEQRLQASLDRSHDRLIRLAKLVRQSVDVNVIDAREAPKLLVGFELHPERGAPVEHPEAVSMAVDRQLAPPAKILHASQANTVQ